MQNELKGPKLSFSRSRRHDEPREPIESTHTLEIVLQNSPWSWKKWHRSVKKPTLINSHYMYVMPTIEGMYISWFQIVLFHIVGAKLSLDAKLSRWKSVPVPNCPRTLWWWWWQSTRPTSQSQCMVTTMSMTANIDDDDNQNHHICQTAVMRDCYHGFTNDWWMK